MFYQIVYGSLLHPAELKKHGITKDRLTLVKVKNFIRIFNQEPSWRKSINNNRAVLNIQVKNNAWINAIAISGITQDDIKELDIRERGYDKLELPKNSVISYNGESLENCIIYIGKKDKVNSTINPNDEYLKLCSDGALSHGTFFYNDYLSSTYKNSTNKIILI